MAHFPIFIDLTAKKCLIFGGGKVALRKIQTLARFDANMEVFSKEVLPEVRAIVPAEKLHLQDHMKEEEIVAWLAQADLVIAATSSREQNHFISKWCKEHQVLVNVIDAPEECTFLFPSIVKKGDISIGINTSGQSPIISKQVRKDVEQAVPDYYEDIMHQLNTLRNRLKQEVEQQPMRQEILRAVAAEAFCEKRALSEEEIQQITLATLG